MIGFDRFICGIGVGVFALGGFPSSAQEADRASTTSFRFEGKAGAEYNSNVALAELDANTGQGDWAATLNILAEATLTPVDKLTLRGGYDFSQSLYQEFDQFNLGIHRGYAELAYDFDVVTVGVLGNLAEASLDGENYLTYRQVSPYLSKQFGATLFLRGAYTATEKEFDGRPERDATAEGISSDVYVFLDGRRRYVALGGKASQEDAEAAELDFNAAAGKIRLVQRFDALGREMTFRAGAEYEHRDYDNPTPSIGAARQDKRTLLDLSIEAPLGKAFFAEASYRFGDYSSNLESANFDEHVGAIKAGVRY
jgi:hypothetical protein